MQATKSNGQGAYPEEPERTSRQTLNTAQREQLDRVLHSNLFRGRDSLKRLLAYLAEQTMGGSNDLKEYTVGIEVFHKPEGYDPQQDASVRQHVAKLRQRLEEYYRTEGKAQPIRIELPKRQFRLEFQDTRPSQMAGLRPAVRHLTIAGLVLLLPVAYWLGSLRRAAELDPAVRLLWAPFLESPKPTIVCLGTPLFLRNHSFRVRDSHLNSADNPEAKAKIQDLQKKLGLDFFVSTFDYTGVGEAYAAFDVARVFAGAHREASLTRANVLSWNEIRGENVIFLGPPKFNPHVDAITGSLELKVNDTEVINTRPRTGERARYERISGSDYDATEDYVLIDSLPGIDPSSKILILEGGSTSSNWAAADYITQAPTVRSLISQIKLANGALPQFYQVLLHVKYQANVPTQTDLVTLRVIRPR